MKQKLHLTIILVVGCVVSALLLVLPQLMPLTGEEGSDTVIALGRFHILVLHFPIALLMVTPLLELIGRLQGLQHLRQVVQSVLWLAITFSVAACGLGFMLAAGEGYAGKLVEAHMWGGIICTILMFVALFFSELSAQLNNGFCYAAYLARMLHESHR